MKQEQEMSQETVQAPVAQKKSPVWLIVLLSVAIVVLIGVIVALLLTGPDQEQAEVQEVVSVEESADPMEEVLDEDDDEVVEETGPYERTYRPDAVSLPLPPLSAAARELDSASWRCPSVSIVNDRQAGPEDLMALIENASDLPRVDDPNKLLKDAQDVVERFTIQTVNFCDVGERQYVVFDQWYGAAFPYEVRGSNLWPLQPITRVRDGIGLTSELIDGQLVLSAGYGDAGIAEWRYYVVDPILEVTRLVESCRSDATFTEEQGILRCDATYQAE